MAAVPAVARAEPDAPTGIFTKENAYLALQSLAIYVGVSVVLPRLLGKTETPRAAANSLVHNSNSPPGISLPTTQLFNLWPTGLLDFRVQISTGNVVDNDSLPTVTWEGIDYTSSGWSRAWNTEFDVPVSVQNNGTLFADVYVTPHSSSPYNDTTDVLHYRKALSRFKPKRKIRTVKNLIKGKTISPEEQQAEDEERERQRLEVMPIISYYHSNLTLQVVSGEPGGLKLDALTPLLQSKIQTKDAAYYPIVFSNDFWLLNEHMQPINSTVQRLPFYMTFSPTSFFRFQTVQTLDDAFITQSEAGGMGSAELDELKRVLSETSWWLLGGTFAISMLHVLFEFLAFSSDVSNWRVKKEMIGVSARTIMASVVSQIIILLYLFDNTEKTSWMILGTQATGVAIESWKLTKILKFEIHGYRIVVLDKHVLTADEKQTQVYDKLAFKYVGIGVLPFVVGYAIYDLLNNSHYSLYSYLITTSTSLVYALGFLQLVPTLIINYKLKSTAHLPRRQLIYKGLSSIADDGAALIVKQPMLRRIAAFRDDVIFLILLYQMYIYKVDPTRVNEYGHKPTEAEATLLLQGESKEVPVESKKDI